MITLATRLAEGTHNLTGDDLCSVLAEASEALTMAADLHARLNVLVTQHDCGDMSWEVDDLDKLARDKLRPLVELLEAEANRVCEEETGADVMRNVFLRNLPHRRIV